MSQKEDDQENNKISILSQIDETLEQDSGWGFPESRIGKLIDRISFNLFGPLFYGKRDKYSLFNKKLRQARIPVSYDVYLSRVVLYSILSAIIGVLIGVLVASSITEVLVNFSLNVNFPSPVASYIENYKVQLAYLVVILFISLIIFTLVTSLFYYYPFYLASERGNKIDASLPHAITFAYAMSRGGANILDVIKALADAEDTYGEVSKEFQAIERNIKMTQTDLRTAVSDEALQTPSDNLQDFLEDFLNVIDTGSDMESFLLNKSERYMEDYKKKQEDLIETLEILSEAYVTAFVASPIFVLVILVVMTMMGGNFITELAFITYLAMPGGAFLFASIIKIISGSADQSYDKIEYEDPYDKSMEKKINVNEIQKNRKYKVSRFYKKQRSIKKKISNIIPTLMTKPYYSFLFTLPLSSIYLLFIYYYQFVDISIEGLVDAPIFNTLILFYIPILMTLGIYSMFYEIKSRREKKILDRLPEFFSASSNANSRGLTMSESFRTVAENTQGKLSDELEKTVNQNYWTDNINKSLVNFTNRLKVPRLTRTMKLIVKSNQITGNIQPVLKVATKDVENMRDLDKARYSNGVIYLMVIVISFLVCMGVIVMIDSSFLTEVEGSQDFEEGASEVGFGGGEVPVDEFRLLFLHLTMILGGGSGIVAGAMSKNSISSGIKISLILMALSLVVFAVF